MSLSRRTFLSVSAAAPVFVALGRSSTLRAWQQQPAPLTPVFTPIRRDVGYFTGRGGTIGYIVNAGGVAVVDSQFPDSAKLCIDGLQERSKSRGVDLLINTHHHGDHTAGNIAFKGIAKRIVANARAAELQRQVYDTAVKTATDKGATAPTEILVADRTFTDTWSEDLGDEKLTAKTYTPAHTSGDAIVIFEKANVVHMGDLMFNRLHPVIDRPAGATVAGWITKVEDVSKAHGKDTIFIGGHAGAKFTPICAQADLMVMRDYLTALLEYVGAQIKAGKTREQVIANTEPVKGFEAHGPMLARSSGPTYDELTAAK
jgi:glyoxylase-like metal-dependent hydrolase (beta-lactamase superfamily II)